MLLFVLFVVELIWVFGVMCWFEFSDEVVVFVWVVGDDGVFVYVLS